MSPGLPGLCLPWHEEEYISVLEKTYEADDDDVS
jgi:hypothetical protein